MLKCCFCCFFKQKTAYEMRISDWSSDVCSSDLPARFLAHPGDIVKLWEGGMSFHGGVIGVSLAIILMARRHKLDWLRIHDYVACVVPIGLGLGRLANFVNGELWGRPTDASWGVILDRKSTRLNSSH